MRRALRAPGGRAAGVAMQVIAPGKTPRGSADQVKTDRKDAELLARAAAGGLLDGGRRPSGRARGGAGLDARA